jgi:hypothetical protein
MVISTNGIGVGEDENSATGVTRLLDERNDESVIAAALAPTSMTISHLIFRISLL